MTTTVRTSNPSLLFFCHAFGRPEPVVEVEEEDDEMEDESELLLERVEEEMAAEVSDDEEENLLHIDDLQNLHIGNKVLIVTFIEIVSTVCHLKMIVNIIIIL
jgi:hypothetical protein